MRNVKKLIALSIIGISIASFNTIGVSATWQRNDKGWWYTEGSSWATGWRNIDGKWYYFYSDGYMAKNTIIDGYDLNSAGAWEENTSISMTSEKALSILKSAYPEYTYIGGGELNTYYKTGEQAYRFTFKKDNCIYMGWVLMDGRYELKFNNVIS